MHPLEAFLSGREIRRATSGIATIAGVVTDGSGDYNIVILETGQTVRASNGNPALTFSVNQTVLYAKADASGRYKNTGYTILGFPPALTRGSSDIASSSGLVSKTGVSVVTIMSAGSVVTSVTVVRGAAASLDLYGSGLDLATIAYGSSELTDQSAPIVTPTHLTLNVKAASGMQPGQYDLTVGGVVFSRFFNVVT